MQAIIKNSLESDLTDIGIYAKRLDETLSVKKRMKLTKSNIKRISAAGIIYLITMGLFHIII